MTRIVLNRKSLVTLSPRKFEVFDGVAAKKVKIADIADIAMNQVAEVVCKVSGVKDVETIKKKGGKKNKRIKMY